MLKIEKTKTDHFEVKLRDKDKRFNSCFFLALLIAVSVHFTAAFLFHVRLFSFGALENILPSSYVTAPLIKSSLDDTDAIVSSLMIRQGRITADHLEPPPFLPKIDNQDLKSQTLLSFKIFNRNKLVFFSDPPFDDNDLNQINIPFFLPTVSIQITGHLAGTLWKNSSEFATFHEKKPFSKKNLKQTTLSFDVRIDGKDGKIFWLDLLNGNSIKEEVISLSKKILLDLQLTEALTDTIYSGQIDLIYSEEA